MDCLYFPDIYSITSVSHRTIDVFATISESLEVTFNSETADFPREQIQNVMHKMMAYRQNMEFPEINKLFYLLSEMILGVVGAHETASNSSKKESVADRIQNKFVKLVSSSDSILPIPTFDQIKVEEYQKQVNEMNKLMRAHTYLYKDLQRQQEVCWIADSKVQKYELCLKTAKLSRNHLADKLSSKNLKARDNSINQLQTTLNYKIQKAEESNRRYQTLLTKEKNTRDALKLEFQTTPTDLKPSFQIHNMLITNQTCRQRKNNHSEPTKEQRNNNNISCQDNQFNFLSNTYVKAKDLTDKTNECFVKIKEGMIVKLKVATDVSEVAFGWYKTDPWNQKRWGFFCKSTENMN
ncbi:Hypothetical predicted protein [Mytilus galloprovincialis]|uniref:Uncharacterized protein n=2 Tax=Mytilus galloprovincialis TaxID=29158 RepID=A0A8B6FDG4_MYTGA|nr:Hypothetical predicted protein [Mytilus galloprovincialis]